MRNHAGQRGICAGLFCFLLLGASACGRGNDSSGQLSGDTLTQRQKDSIISTLPVPGANAVGRALDASDAARARAEQHDTIGEGGGS
jgi:hypothetical protein